jgi:hypothetical protein
LEVYRPKEDFHRARRCAVRLRRPWERPISLKLIQKLLDLCCSTVIQAVSGHHAERHGCIAKVPNWRFFLRESALSLARARIFSRTSIRSL